MVQLEKYGQTHLAKTAFPEEKEISKYFPLLYTAPPCPHKKALAATWTEEVA